MATAEELLEELLEKQLELVRARKGSEREAALEERIATLEKRLEEKPKAEREEALEEITDEEYELIRQHRAAAPPPAPKAEPAPAPAPAAKRTRPGRKSGMAYEWYVDDAGKVVKTDIANIYNGADEPDEVELPDEEAA